jgi:hypothetical protein
MAKGKDKSKKAEDAPRVDPNLPRKDGPNVSSNGGLVFVAVIGGLLLLAVVAQFLAGG